jgi:hypothetical protein
MIMAPFFVVYGLDRGMLTDRSGIVKPPIWAGKFHRYGCLTDCGGRFAGAKAW